MAHALPVVCSTSGVDGLPDKHHNGCLVSGNAEQMAADIDRLLSNATLYEAQSQLGRKYFLQHFTTAEVYQKLDAALNVTVHAKN